jgi:hypothetical protein
MAEVASPLPRNIQGRSTFNTFFSDWGLLHPALLIRADHSQPFTAALAVVSEKRFFSTAWTDDFERLTAAAAPDLTFLYWILTLGASNRPHWIHLSAE